MPYWLPLLLLLQAGCANNASNLPLRGGVNVLLKESTSLEEVEDALFLVQDLEARVVVFNFQWCLDGEDSELRACDLTPEESLVIEACELGRELGLEVRLRPLISERTVGWRGNLTPHRTWMDSYRQLSLELSLFAELHEIDAIYFVSELHTAMQDTPGFFAELVWSIRDRYRGEIALTEFIWTSHAIPEDWFFDDTRPTERGVDLVGASYYPELPSPDEDLFWQMEDFLARVSARTDRFLEQVDEVSEFGVVPSSGERSASWQIEGEPDEEYQARYYLAILDSMREHCVETTILWGLEPGHPDLYLGPFAPLEPGREVLRAEWARWQTGG